MVKRVVVPGHYYGLDAIAKKLGCSTYGVRLRIAKMRFPAFHQPARTSAGGYGYCWYTNDALINYWSQLLIDEARDKLVRSKTGRNMAVRESDIQPANQSSQVKSKGASLGAPTPDDSTHP